MLLYFGQCTMSLHTDLRADWTRWGVITPNTKPQNFSRCLGLTQKDSYSQLFPYIFQNVSEHHCEYPDWFLLVHPQTACWHDSYKDQLHIWANTPGSRCPDITYSESSLSSLLIAYNELPYWGAHLTVCPAGFISFLYIDIRTVLHPQKKYYPLISSHQRSFCWYVLLSEYW